jgi:Di-haem oxidoreductase, putative peroxidase
MGAALSDAGSSYSDDLESRDAPKRGEWRTPPLWGFRDSGPYLHDGRAPDLEQAVEMHGGQAAASAREFRAISPSQRSLIHTFLNSLAAPGSAGSTEVSRAADAEARDVERTWSEDVVRRATSRLHTAEQLEKMDKTQGALEFYQAIIREAPDSAPARTAARRIRHLEGKLPRDP